MDPLGLNYLYQMIVQFKTSLEVRLSITAGMESAPSTLPVSEQTTLVPESVTDLMPVPAASSALMHASIIMSSLAVTATNTAYPAPTTIIIVEASSLAVGSIAPPMTVVSPPDVADLEEEFIMELIDSFYNSLRWCLLLVLKDMKTLFESLKVILTYSIKSIKYVGGAE